MRKMSDIISSLEEVMKQIEDIRDNQGYNDIDRDNPKYLESSEKYQRLLDKIANQLKSVIDDLRSQH